MNNFGDGIKPQLTKLSKLSGSDWKVFLCWSDPRNEYKSAKTNFFKEEIRTVFYDDGLPVEETQCKAYLIILVILNTESTIVSKIFFILSKYLSFFRFKLFLYLP